MKLLYATGPYRYAGHGLRGGSFSAESRDRPHEEGESTGNEVGEQATLDTTFQKKTWSIEIKVYSGLLCTRNTYIHSFFIRTFLIRTLRLSMLRTYPRLRQRTSLFCPIIFVKWAVWINVIGNCRPTAVNWMLKRNLSAAPDSRERPLKHVKSNLTLHIRRTMLFGSFLGFVRIDQMKYCNM